jgi:hypothetical protein
LYLNGYLCDKMLRGLDKLYLRILGCTVPCTPITEDNFYCQISVEDMFYFPLCFIINLPWGIIIFNMFLNPTLMEKDESLKNS